VNIFDAIPTNLSNEVFSILAESGDVKIERIVSKGHTSPATGWYDQTQNEWLIVLRANAIISFEDLPSVTLQEGDYMNIPAHEKHRVKWTDPDVETVWLAVHYS